MWYGLLYLTVLSLLGAAIGQAFRARGREQQVEDALRRINER